ncbi:MAG: DUF1338 domain-containing protein [Bacteroidales bacterium]
MNIEMIFDRLWMHYAAQNPSARKIKALFMAQGEEVMNDHVAFRTFDYPEVGIDRIARLFLSIGYEPRAEYEFTEKNLRARHYEHKTDKSAPRVFISELITQRFSPFLRELALECVRNIPPDVLNSDELLFSGNQWGIPSIESYNKLRAESEYAAWVYVFGFRANHFTVSVNSLKKFSALAQVNAFLKENGFLLNTAGGEIKGTSADLLEQSSTMADIVPIHFMEGVFDIPSCYYEFAMRHQDANGQLFSGFIEKSANRIFESTDFYNK